MSWSTTMLATAVLACRVRLRLFEDTFANQMFALHWDSCAAGEGERAGGGRWAGSGSRSKKYPRGTDASSQFGAQLENSGPSV